jgi:hypothetical protein
MLPPAPGGDPAWSLDEEVVAAAAAAATAAAASAAAAAAAAAAPSSSPSSLLSSSSWPLPQVEFEYGLDPELAQQQQEDQHHHRQQDQEHHHAAPLLAAAAPRPPINSSSSTAAAAALPSPLRGPAANVGRDPALERAIGRWINEAPDWPALRFLVDRWALAMNAAHFASLAHRLASLAGADGGGGSSNGTGRSNRVLASAAPHARMLGRSERAAFARLAADALAGLRRAAPGADGATAAAALHALLRLRGLAAGNGSGGANSTPPLPLRVDPGLVDVLLLHQAPHAAAMRPRDAARTLWALGRLRHGRPADPTWLGRFLSSLAEGPALREAGGRELAAMAHGLGGLTQAALAPHAAALRRRRGAAAAGAWAPAAELAVAALGGGGNGGGSSSTTTAVSAAALASFDGGGGGTWQPGYVGVGALANSLDEEWVDPGRAAAAASLSASSSSSSSSSALAASAAVPPPSRWSPGPLLPRAFCALLLDRMRPALPSMSDQELSMALVGLARCGCRPPAPWMEAALAEARGRFAGAPATDTSPAKPPLPPQALANVLWAVARMGHFAPSRGWLAAYCAASARALERSSPEELAAQAWAFARLKAWPSDAWLDEFFDVTEARAAAGKMPVRDLTTAAWSLARLGLRPPQSWVRRFCAALLRATRGGGGGGAAAAAAAALGGSSAALASWQQQQMQQQTFTPQSSADSDSEEDEEEEEDVYLDGDEEEEEEAAEGFYDEEEELEDEEEEEDDDALGSGSAAARSSSSAAPLLPSQPLSSAWPASPVPLAAAGTPLEERLRAAAALLDPQQRSGGNGTSGGSLGSSGGASLAAPQGPLLEPARAHQALAALAAFRVPNLELWRAELHAAAGLRVRTFSRARRRRLRERRRAAERAAASSFEEDEDEDDEDDEGGGGGGGRGGGEDRAGSGSDGSKNGGAA